MIGKKYVSHVDKMVITIVLVIMNLLKLHKNNI